MSALLANAMGFAIFAGIYIIAMLRGIHLCDGADDIIVVQGDVSTGGFHNTQECSLVAFVPHKVVIML